MVAGFCGSTRTLIRASNLFVRVKTEIKAYVTGISASRALLTAVTWVRRLLTRCDVTRAGAGGSRSALALDAVVVVRNVSHSVVSGRPVVRGAEVDGFPAPTLLMAVTVKEYCVNDFNPVTTQLRPDVVHWNRFDGCATSDASTTYAVMGRPPLDAGALHDTFAEVDAGTMTPMVGAPGTEGMVVVWVEAIDCPIAFTARTETVNDVPRCSDSTVHDVESGDARVHVP